MLTTQLSLLDLVEAPELPARVALQSKQQVECVWCGWKGDSPVKKHLAIAGTDYPLVCRQCNAAGLKPLEAKL